MFVSGYITRDIPLDSNPTIHHRAHLATVCRIAARAPDGPSIWLPPLPHI